MLDYVTAMTDRVARIAACMRRMEEVSREVIEVQ